MPLFGQRLSALRKAEGIIQREFADLLGTTREMIDYYERRAVNPALEVVRSCAKALNVPVSELLGSDDSCADVMNIGDIPQTNRRYIL